MTIETVFAVATRDALSRFTSQTLPSNVDAGDGGDEYDPQDSNPGEGVSLSLSARGRLLAALSAGSDALASSTAQEIQAGSTTVVSTAAGLMTTAQSVLPITRATLFAIEARLLAARRGASAIAAADAELPPSSDPQRLRQAAQATESLYGRAANPFTDLSRAQLSAIVYDESGAYTVNERYAAAAQREELDRRFWQPVLQRALASGDWRPMIEAGLVFYASLSPLEQTAYPANYLQLMQQYLALPDTPTDTPLPSQQQADLVSALASLVLPGGPLAQASGGLRSLVLMRALPTAEALAAAMPRLVNILSVRMVGMSMEQSYQVMLQRVFGVSQRDAEPMPLRRAGSPHQAREMLSFADRRFLADAYAYAASADIAVEEVDALAADLARYRLERAGGRADADARLLAASPQVYRMSGADAMVARRLLTSTTARDTRLDHAFLAWLLDPRGAGWSEGERSGHLVGFSALEKLLAGLVGMAGMGAQAVLDEADLASDYRYALYRLSLQNLPEAAEWRAQGEAAAPRAATLAAQMAALARGSAADRDFMESALALLRMYRSSLRMTDGEQRTLSEMVYASMRRRRMRTRRGKVYVAWSSSSDLMPAMPSSVQRR